VNNAQDSGCCGNSGYQKTSNCVSSFVESDVTGRLFTAGQRLRRVVKVWTNDVVTALKMRQIRSSLLAMTATKCHHRGDKLLISQFVVFKMLFATSSRVQTVCSADDSCSPLTIRHLPDLLLDWLTDYYWSLFSKLVNEDIFLEQNMSVSKLIYRT